LAEAQTRYLSSHAELQAHEQELRRTDKLVEIGAASRQQLERIHAEHTAATTIVASQRSRLKLLGMTDSEIAALSPTSEVGATVHIAAPLDGVITTRAANVGLNVDATTPLFTVVDLSTVWVVGDLYERDFGAIRVGSPATITTTAYPNMRVEGKVSYLDPQIKTETRTAQVRVEVSNPKTELRLGMYAEMQVGEPRPNATPVVPRSAVQVVADRSVVYVVNQKERGRFIEREVRLGETRGDDVQISGVQVGDVVVTKGSFSIRAERERLGLRPPVSATLRSF
jgi:RND family efflux transporter MFP subunit